MAKPVASGPLRPAARRGRSVARVAATVGQTQAADNRLVRDADKAQSHQGVHAPDGATPESIRRSALYQEVKFRALEMVHDYLETQGHEIAELSAVALRQEIIRAVSVAISGVGIAVNSDERDSLVEDVRFELTGLGPLEPLLADPTVDDILVNQFDRIFVERNGTLEPVTQRFRDNDHLLNIIQRIVSPLGRRVDENSPFVDARLPDGSRVNIVVPPVMIDGPTISIRKFKRIPLTGQDLVRKDALNSEMLEYLARCVRARLNILISGGTGAGKTTLLNILSAFINPKERLVTIEDAAELQLRQPHVARMETRPPGPEGGRAITARELLQNSLRMRPDRVILGEVRGGEAVDMLQAMTIGHDGSMGTIHANSPKDALLRLELLLGFGGLNADTMTLRRHIARAVNVIVQLERTMSGGRRIVHIAEIGGMEGDTILLHDRYRFERDKVHSDRGRFAQLSQNSTFTERLELVAPVGALAALPRGGQH